VEDSAGTDDDSAGVDDELAANESATPIVDLSEATVGDPPQEAVAFNDFDTSWTDGTAVA
jgi:hypothetical protein